jgi:hypothetical protein
MATRTGLGIVSLKARSPRRSAHVAAGILSGLVCLAGFLVIHAIWITPIWNVAIIGVLMAAGGGAVSRSDARERVGSSAFVALRIRFGSGPPRTLHRPRHSPPASS